MLLLDEIDALATSRSREMHEASRRMLSVLLRRMDGVEASPTTTLIGATNRREDLDAALLSRFGVRVHFAAPQVRVRVRVWVRVRVSVRVKVRVRVRVSVRVRVRVRVS